MFLANPNNPFGVTSKEIIEALVEKNPQAIVVIDETYAELSQISVGELLWDHKNMVILRSFSKGYCLAGMRIGYIIAHPEVICKIKEKSTWANVSYPAVGAAFIALQNEKYFESLRQDVRERREKFVEFLKSKNIKTLPSFINAILIKFPTEKDGSRFVTYLNEHNVFVSHGNANSNVGLDDSYVRIAVGTKEEMEYLQGVITSYIL